MDKYDEIKCIGRGAFGSAHLVTLRGTTEKYVVKKIPIELLTDKEKAQSFREVELLAKLKHPNVVEYRENFVKDNVIHIVMAYCDGGDLAEKIRERVALLEQAAAAGGDCARAYFDIGQILDWFVQMAMAIKYLHQQRILHRDLKTSNIFLTTENVIKLGDFGIAKTLDSTLDQARTVVGTPYYMSPEVCESKPYSYASDVWSLGCVLYEMCALKHAFDAPNIISLIFTIVRKEVRVMYMRWCGCYDKYRRLQEHSGLGRARTNALRRGDLVADQATARQGAREATVNGPDLHDPVHSQPHARARCVRRVAASQRSRAPPARSAETPRSRKEPHATRVDRQ